MLNVLDGVVAVLHRAVHRTGAGRLDRAAGVGVGGVVRLLVAWLSAGVLAQGPSPALALQVRGAVERAIAAGRPVGGGACRFAAG